MAKLQVGRTLVAMVIASMVAFVVVAPAAWAQTSSASPCSPGQPTGRPAGTPPASAPGQPAGRPPQYPPGQCQLQLSRNTVAQGGTLGVSGSGYDPNSSANLQIFSTPADLATVTTDAQGRFSVTVTIPANTVPGRHTISGTGYRNGAPYQLTADLTVTAAGASTARGDSGTLPRTGAFIAGLTAIGAALMGAGTIAVLAARRRRTGQTA